jgi:hypothetical protein
MDQLLPLTPALKPWENPLGYALRVAEANSLPSPWLLLRIVGLTQSRMKSVRFDPAVLASLVGQSTETLTAIGYSDVRGASRSLSFRGHRVSRGELSYRRPRMCVDCVGEQGTVCALWDLQSCTACHIHSRRLISSCAGCGQNLSYFRPGLLSCRCGSDLSKQRGEEVTEPERFSNALLAAAALPEWQSSVALGIELAQQLRLAGLTFALALFESVGLFALYERPDQATCAKAAPADIMHAAGKALRDWPNGFQRFLDRLLQRPPNGSQDRFGTLGCIDDFLSRLGVRKSQRPGFFRDQIAMFLQRHPRPPETIRATAHKTARNPLSGDSKLVAIESQWVDVAEGARIMGVDRRFVKRIAARHSASTRTILQGRVRKTLILKEDLPRKGVQRTHIIGEREAGRRLSLPVSVLRELRNREIFTVTHTGPWSDSYAERDVKAFADKLLALGANARPRPADTITWRKVMLSRPRGRCTKAEIVEAVLDGRVRCWKTNATDPTNDLVLDFADLRRLFDAHVARVGLSIEDVAQRLHLSKPAIRQLVESGLIQVHRADPNRVVIDSVQRFCDQHALLNERLFHKRKQLLLAKRYLTGNSIPHFTFRCRQSRGPKLIVLKKDLAGVAATVLSRRPVSWHWSPNSPYHAARSSGATRGRT